MSEEPGDDAEVVVTVGMPRRSSLMLEHPATSGQTATRAVVEAIDTVIARHDATTNPAAAASPPFAAELADAARHT